MRVKCPNCEDENFSGCKVTMEFFNLDIEDIWENFEYGETYDRSNVIECNGCGKEFVFEKGKLREATQQDKIKDGIVGYENFSTRAMKEKDFDMIKKIKMLGNLKNENK